MATRMGPLKTKAKFEWDVAYFNMQMMHTVEIFRNRDHTQVQKEMSEAIKKACRAAQKRTKRKTMSSNSYEAQAKPTLPFKGLDMPYWPLAERSFWAKRRALPNQTR